MKVFCIERKDMRHEQECKTQYVHWAEGNADSNSERKIRLTQVGEEVLEERSQVH